MTDLPDLGRRITRLVSLLPGGARGEEDVHPTAMALLENRKAYLCTLVLGRESSRRQ